ncbi:hypothetical protein V5N11_008677 [Cardamine amara subsp. amara]|uniref:RNase H type-1 domain-containing protein n=1 Tax=Cardamine amara subsp. amara TaxID=228776 RepID=A0ABD0ZYN1_CARAN
MYKCNVDAAWKKDAETCGVGWILRDDKGKARWYGAKAYPVLLSSLEAEATALSWAMRCLDNLGFGSVVFESADSQILMKAVCNPPLWPRLTNYM